jgi:hypothetical protein
MARIVPAIHDEDGGMSIYGLYVFVICAMLGGLALDIQNVYSNRSQLQVAADLGAHAALSEREFRTSQESIERAQILIGSTLPWEKFGETLTKGDIRFGIWHGPDLGWQDDLDSAQAVRVDTARLNERGNGLRNFLLQFAGVGDWDIRTTSIFETYKPGCLTEGFVAEGLVDIQSNNSYFNGFCIHSNQYVKVSSNNYFAEDTVVSMPRTSDLQLPNSGFETNPGLEDALHDHYWKLKILGRLEDIIADLGVVGDRYTPDYITSKVVVNIASKNVNEQDFERGRVHRIQCNGGQQIFIKDSAFLQEVVIVTNCPIKFGQGTRLEDVVIATTSTDAKSMNAPSTLQLGRNDACAPGGGAQLLTLGGVDFAADLRMFGGQIIARGDVTFSANADGVQGASIISGGTISGSSNMNMGRCGTGMEGNFEAQYFRLAA